MKKLLSKLKAAAVYDEPTISKLREISNLRTGSGTIGQLDRDWLRTILDDYEKTQPLLTAQSAVIERLAQVVHDHAPLPNGERYTNCDGCDALEEAQAILERATK